MDSPSVCPTNQADKQYTVQVNSSSAVYSSYIQNHYKIYITLKASLTFTDSQLIQLILQYLAKIYATVSLKVICNLAVILQIIKWVR
jgi:hypothetical protein